MPMERVVFRLRQLPQYVDRLETAQLLSRSLGIDPSAIHIFSLARSTDPWTPSKTATLQFSETTPVQEILKRNEKGKVIKSGDEWKVRVENLKDSLVLDTHFRGLTPLYDPPVHDADCIAISGLSSHPFGSWQPKGGSKTFMWIRDALPKSLPNVRPILYGYDTTLADSNSFQSILDLALGLLNHITANGWASSTSKPLVFLAHSLGGIVLKQALVSLAGRIQRDDPLRQAVRGAIFFGVPNLGMEQSHLSVMVDGQPNEAIVADLSVNSRYLCQLDEQFCGIAYLQCVQLYWAYETRKSPTVTVGSYHTPNKKLGMPLTSLQRNEDGAWERAGIEEILVTPHSATRGLYRVHAKSHLILPVNENHSNMVKFTENDPDYSIVVDKLMQIAAQMKNMPDSKSKSAIFEGQHNTSNQEDKVAHTLWTLDALERNNRLEQIEDKFRNTFEWIYDLKETGFNRWLQTGHGIFWINGKPGSGKSTLMKFIFRDSRTRDLLSDWKTATIQIRAAFFLHYRGTVMQKSFAGLLRSVLTQIVEQCPSLSSYMLPPIGDEPVRFKEDWTLSRLQRGLFQVMEQDQAPFHLCLFLDALDEYDGQLEVICRFLSDISRIPQTATKRIQICFSSRPWDIFTREFEGCPGFSMQDFTRNDISDYCLGFFRNNQLSAAELEGLVPKVVERAKGVFLWVKLVVKDLAQTFMVTTDKQELQRLLTALPTELDEYYAEIIERIPHAHRSTAYVMLEIAARSKEPLTPRAFLYALRSATSKSHTECVAAHEALRHKELTRPEMKDFATLVAQHSGKYCGGLIEVVKLERHSVYGIEKQGIQVFHQTVEDFVLSPRFKTLMLGDSAKITVENGHCFLAKFFFEPVDETGTKSQRNFPDIKYYAQAAEDSTGRSMKYFWESVPDTTYRTFGAQTSLGFAIIAGLRLVVWDKLAENPDVLKESPEPLLTYVVKSSSPDDVIAMVRDLLDAGFKPDQGPDAFRYIVTRIHDEVRSPSPYEYASYLNEYLDIAKTLLENGQSTEVEVRLMEEDVPMLTGKPLHRGPLSLAKLLIEYTANVNALDSRGQTPLDHKCEWVPRGGQAGIRDSGAYLCLNEKMLTLEELYQMICLLVSKGGTTRKAKARAIERRLEEFAKHGWETEALHHALLTKSPSFITRFRTKFVDFSTR